ncbi:MAG: hypothetical protein ACODAD_10735 [Planctomycetota bacterium]
MATVRQEYRRDADSKKAGDDVSVDIVSLDIDLKTKRALSAQSRKKLATTPPSGPRRPADQHAATGIDQPR